MSLKKNSKFSIKAKLLSAIIPITSAMIIVLVVIAYNVSASMIKRNAEELLETSVDKQSSNIEAWMTENLNSFNSAKKAIEADRQNEKSLQKTVDSYYDFNANSKNGIYIADQNGKVIKAKKSDKTISNPLNSTWFKEGLTRVNMAFGDPYTSEDGSKVISATGMLDDNSKNIRVIAADFSLDRISNIVNSSISMEGAKAFLVNKNTMQIMADRNSSYVSEKIGSSDQPEIYAQAKKEIKKSNYSTQTLGENFTAFSQIEGTDWILVSYIPSSIVLADLSKLRIIMAIVSLIALLIMCIVVERVTHVAIKPVKEMTKVITAMAGGDFTVSVRTNGNDEIAEMGRSVSKFIAYMRQMISSITTISHTLEKQALDSERVANEMSSASDTQSKSMNELNMTVDQLAISVNDIAENASQLAEVVTDTKDNSDHAKNKMNDTVEVSNKGREDMKQVVTALENIQSSVTTLQDSINSVGKASGEIVNIVKIIGEIAHQPNLLSLNASLEAARAGEAGKGFAVVATEINNLAKSSAESVSQISELIDQVNGLVANTVQQASSSVKDINSSAVLINTAVESFDTIYHNIQETSNVISKVVEEIDSVDQVATNVAAISEEQAASSGEIHATSETTLSQAKNISENSTVLAEESQHLAATSEELADQVKHFRV